MLLQEKWSFADVGHYCEMHRLLHMSIKISIVATNWYLLSKRLVPIQEIIFAQNRALDASRKSQG